MTDYEKQMCQRCDHYRGYICAEHREPTYERLVLQRDVAKRETERVMNHLESSRKVTAGVKKQRDEARLALEEMTEACREADKLREEIGAELNALQKEHAKCRADLEHERREVQRLFAAKEDAMRMYQQSQCDVKQAVQYVKDVIGAEEEWSPLDDEWFAKTNKFIDRVENMQFLPCCAKCGVPTLKMYMVGDTCMPCSDTMQQLNEAKLRSLVTDKENHLQAYRKAADEDKGQIKRLEAAIQGLTEINNRNVVKLERVRAARDVLVMWKSEAQDLLRELDGKLIYEDKGLQTRVKEALK